MNFTASVLTTFPDSMWSVYGQKFMENLRQYWPKEIALLVMLDDDKLVKEVEQYLRPTDAIAINENEEHQKFRERNKDKEHPTDYRKQAIRFSHKVWALKMASDMWKQQPGQCQYLIWLDADVMVTRQVRIQDIAQCLPHKGASVSYLGRKDWPHSECGWMAFDLSLGGHAIIDRMYEYYITDKLFELKEWHDSYVFDDLRAKITLEDMERSVKNGTPDDLGTIFHDLTRLKPGMDIWPHSPMAAWSRHYKGPLGKQDLARLNKQEPMQQQFQNLPQGPKSNIKIQTKNSIADEVIRAQIMENLGLIDNWISPCAATDEEIVVVSAGPEMVAEDLQEEVAAGRKIVAVKHALDRLKEANIPVWACILLDPRPHVAEFVKDPDKDVIWFVASQVHPSVVRKLLEKGCTVWGYHAAVGAGEGPLCEKQFGAIVSGGTATATRGLFMLDRLGFRNFRLYGYDLSFPDKPDMGARDQLNQPKYFDFTVTAGGAAFHNKKFFWTEPQLIAQFEEINQIMQMKTDWKIKAFGYGMVPFLYRTKEVNDLRMSGKMYKLTSGKPIPYEEMLWPNKKKSSVDWRKWLPSNRRKPMQGKPF